MGMSKGCGEGRDPDVKSAVNQPRSRRGTLRGKRFGMSLTGKRQLSYSQYLVGESFTEYFGCPMLGSWLSVRLAVVSNVSYFTGIMGTA